MKDFAEIVKTLLEIIKQNLENGEDVLVSGLGKFTVQEKAPRKGRNPATDDDLMIDVQGGEFQMLGEAENESKWQKVSETRALI